MSSNHHNTYSTYLMAAVLTAVGVILDQWTKHLAVAKQKDQDPIILIDKVFQLRYLENRGAAFGIFQNKLAFFLICTLVILAVVVYFYLRLPKSNRYTPLRFCMIFICAGAIGNMIDRIRLGYVVDFFYFNLIDFPIFNVADIYVTVSAFLLAALICFYYKEEDFEEIFQRGK